MKRAGKILLCIVILIVILFCGMGVFMRSWISQTYKRLDEVATVNLEDVADGSRHACNDVRCTDFCLAGRV